MAINSYILILFDKDCIANQYFYTLATLPGTVGRVYLKGFFNPAIPFSLDPVILSISIS